MIAGFRHRGLELFFERGNARYLRADQAAKIRRILTALEAASAIQDVNLPRSLSKNGNDPFCGGGRRAGFVGPPSQNPKKMLPRAASPSHRPPSQTGSLPFFNRLLACGSIH